MFVEWTGCILIMAREREGVSLIVPIVPVSRSHLTHPFVSVSVQCSALLSAVQSALHKYSPE